MILDPMTKFELATSAHRTRVRAATECLLADGDPRNSRRAGGVAWRRVGRS